MCASHFTHYVAEILLTSCMIVWKTNITCERFVLQISDIDHFLVFVCLCSFSLCFSLNPWGSFYLKVFFSKMINQESKSLIFADHMGNS